MSAKSYTDYVVTLIRSAIMYMVAAAVLVLFASGTPDGLLRTFSYGVLGILTVFFVYMIYCGIRDSCAPVREAAPKRATAPSKLAAPRKLA